MLKFFVILNLRSYTKLLCPAVRYYFKIFIILKGLFVNFMVPTKTAADAKILISY